MSEVKGKNTIVKDAIILFIITLIAGVALAFVHDITAEPIAKANAEAKAKAYQTVFADAASFEEDADVASKVEANKEKYDGAIVDEVLCAVDAGGNKIGYVMSLTATEGYGGNISLSLGVAADGTITGFEILAASETAGLGAKCKEPEFKSQFAGIKAAQIEYTKTGKSADNQIDALSGATITTSAVTKAVNAGLNFFAECGN